MYGLLYIHTIFNMSYYYDDALPESQEKFLIDMVIEAYNKEFQYKPFS